MHRNVRPVTTLVATALVVLLAAGLSLGLVACSSPSDESEIRSAVAMALDAFKNPTEQSLEPYFDASGNESLQQMADAGVDVYDILAHVFSKFDYAVGDITVDGDTATAAVTATNVDLQKVSETLQNDLANDQSFLGQLILKGAQGDTEGIYASILDKIYTAIEATADTATADATLQLTRTDGTWTVDEDSVGKLVSDSFENLDMGELVQAGKA